MSMNTNFGYGYPSYNNYNRPVPSRNQPKAADAKEEKVDKTNLEILIIEKIF